MPDQNQGRQSPDPETQSNAQAGAPASGGPSASKATDPKETLKNLESNPKHILEDAAAEKTSKK